MLTVSISQIVRSPQGDVPELLAEFSVDDEGLHAEAGRGLELIGEISVIDPASGDPVLSSEDPVRWARLLPLALRAGDIAIRVREQQSTGALASADGDPAQALAQEIGAELPAPAAFA